MNEFAKTCNSNEEKGSTILVSICMLSYNHEAFIGEAIEGVLAQKVDFNFEILIHDDASTDKTVEIIKKYESLYPEKIKAIFQNENKWSKGINPSVYFNYPRVKGDFVAWCEGDDVWTDPLKLKKQIEILQKYKNVDLCFHKSVVKNYANLSVEDKVIGNFRKNNGIVDFEDVFLRNFGGAPTASCVVRKECMDALREFMAPRPYLTSGDIYMQAIASMRGGAYYIDEAMSIYRYRTPSSLTLGMGTDVKKWVNHHAACIRGMVSLWKNYFGNTTDFLLKKAIYKRLIWIFVSESKSKYVVEEMRLEKIWDLYKKIEALLIDVVDRFDRKKIILYGSGNEAKRIIENCSAERFYGIVDAKGFFENGEFHGVPFMKLSDINFKEDVFFYGTTLSVKKNDYDEIFDEKKIAKDKALILEDILDDAINVDELQINFDLMNESAVFSLQRRVDGWYSV